MQEKLTLQEMTNEAERLITDFLKTDPVCRLEHAPLNNLHYASDLLIRASFIIGRMSRALAGETS